MAIPLTNHPAKCQHVVLQLSGDVNSYRGSCHSWNWFTAILVFPLKINMEIFWYFWHRLLFTWTNPSYLISSQYHKKQKNIVEICWTMWRIQFHFKTDHLISQSHGIICKYQTTVMLQLHQPHSTRMYDFQMYKLVTKKTCCESKRLCIVAINLSGQKTTSSGKKKMFLQ